MNLIGSIIDKFTVSNSAESRVNGRHIIDKLNETGSGRVVLSSDEAMELRNHLAEKLGRELADTPLPGSYDNVELIVDPKK